MTSDGQVSPLERVPWALKQQKTVMVDGYRVVVDEVPTDLSSVLFGPRTELPRHSVLSRAGHRFKPLVELTEREERGGQGGHPDVFVLGLDASDPRTAKITEWSAGLAHLTGIPASAVLGRRLHELLQESLLAGPCILAERGTPFVASPPNMLLPRAWQTVLATSQDAIKSRTERPKCLDDAAGE
jgi:hypothetical protein